MFRSCRVKIAHTLALCFLFSSVVLVVNSGSVNAQDNAAAGGIGFAPKTVQDEGSLVQKASFFIGYNVMKDLDRSTSGKVDMAQVVEGMKAAANGDDRDSFVAGYQMFSQSKERGFDLELEQVVKGMTAASAGEELGMSSEQIQVMMTAYQSMVEQKQIEKMKQKSTANIAEGEAFIQKLMAEDPNAKKLDNGVVYQVLTEGTGPIPTPENRVKVDYHGTFMDGSVFDSSIDPPSGLPPAPAEFGVSGVVPGFSKALQNMKVGSKWRIVIPGPQGYGAAGGAGGAIGPNQTLIFELSLLEILN